ncbi:hypothetical protein VTK56DRAFT_8575 [Thermocarpiscus australiensis]
MKKPTVVMTPNQPPPPTPKMMPQQACCTCATLLSAVPRVSSASEKPLPDDRRLGCCNRIICGGCIQKNPRFLSYCPYCQTSGQFPLSSRLLDRQQSAQDLDPPPYSSIAATATTTSDIKTEPPDDSCPPPPYAPPSPFEQQPPPPAPKDHHSHPAEQPEYTIHYLRHHHPHDTIPSLSLRYGIPAALLRRANNLTSDHLLAARHTLLIPTTTTTTTTNNDNTATAHCRQNHHGISMSLSPHPLEDAGETARKTAIRRLMVACKEPDYDVAVLYLEEVGYDLDEAVRRYVEDERWEREHPLVERNKRGEVGRSRGRKKGGGGTGWGFGRR